MKILIVALMATAGITFAGAASAQADLAQKNCGSCHALDTKKMGPAFKDIAAKYKGNASAEADLVAKVTGGKGHPAVKASKEDVTAIVKWVLMQ
ncbi:MAG TPA: c-type cytochrome [Burkholderiaceae bacterium]|nr:c-type cytochrome [Burkholderiaceae bacterium]